MNLPGYEDVWIKATFNDKSTIVIRCLCRHPQPDYFEFSKVFNKNILHLKAKQLVVLEVLNVDYSR